MSNTSLGPDGENTELGTLAVAIFDFDGDREDMLQFKEGDVLTIIEMNDNGWWKASSTSGRVGIFPYNYVELQITEEKKFPFARAVYALPPNEEDLEQLTFEEGEIITILKEVNAEWSIGKRANGDTGRFPKQYVEETGELNEELFKMEVEKWEKLKLEREREQEKLLAEKAELEKQFLVEERDKKEEKMMAELEKARKEAAELRRQNEEHLAEIKRQKEEFLQMQRDLLVRQERTRRELDVAKAEAASLRKVQDKKEARKSVLVKNRIYGEEQSVRRRARNVRRNFGSKSPGPPPTAEVLDLEEDPFASTSRPSKRAAPMIKPVYAKQKTTEEETTVDKPRGQVITQSWI